MDELFVGPWLMSFKCLDEDWAPGLIAGMEGFCPEIVAIDLETKIITLKFTGITIIDAREKGPKK